MGAPSEEPGYFLDADPAVVFGPAPETVGGGGITFEIWFGADWKRPEGDALGFVREFPTDGGGAITLAVPGPGDGLRDAAVALTDATVGGGGTTSCVPKNFPMRLLTKDPLAD